LEGAAIIGVTALLFVGTSWWAPRLLPNFFVVVAAGFVAIGRGWRSVAPHERAILVSYIFFLHYFLNRADGVHLSVLIPLMTALLPHLLDIRRRSAAVLAAGAMLAVAVSLNDTAPFTLIGRSNAGVGIRVLSLKGLPIRESDSTSVIQDQRGPE